MGRIRAGNVVYHSPQRTRTQDANTPRRPMTRAQADLATASPDGQDPMLPLTLPNPLPDPVQLLDPHLPHQQPRPPPQQRALHLINHLLTEARPLELRSKLQLVQSHHNLPCPSDLELKL
jgi:hypothetical protein